MIATVRLATAADAVLLPALERSAGELFRTLPELTFVADHPVDPPEDYLPLIADGHVWIAQDADGRAVGCLSGEIEDGAFHILEIAVAREAQGEGHGRRLLDAARDHARARGIPAVTLTTFAHVAWNGPFYARYGFETVRAPTGALAAHLTEEAARGLPHRVAMRLAV